MSVKQRPALANDLVLAIGPAILIASVVGKRKRNVWPTLAQGLSRLRCRYFVKKDFLYPCKQLGQCHCGRVIRGLIAA